MAKTTTAELIVKHPQWVVEVTEGVKVTATPSYTSLGAVKTIGIKINGNFVDLAQVASEDLIAIIQGLQEYETQFTMSVVNSTGIIKRLINTANEGTPAGTVSETLNIVFSIYLNGVENYIFLLGSRVKDGSITMETGKETEVTVSFTHTSISTPSSTSGLTGPVHATLPSGDVFDWMSGGANPVSWNSIAQDCKKVTVNINRNTKSDHILGNVDPHSTRPHGRRISFDFTNLWTATTLEADFKAGTARTLAVVLKSAVSTITISNAKLVDHAKDYDIGSGETIAEQVTGRALTASVT